MRAICLSVLGSALLGTLFAQAPPARLEFEVTSVKPAPPIIAGPAPVNIGMHIDGAQVHFNGFSLKDYVRMAYRVKPYQVTGPDWMESTRFDIDAKLPAGGTREQVPEMLQALLTDRFQLKFHRESKEFPVYALEIAPGGLKVKDLTDSSEEVDAKAPTEVQAQGGPAGVGVSLPGGASYTFSNNKFVGTKLTTVYLTDILTRFMDRPVVDMTGLNGKYSFTIPLAEEDYRTMLIRSAISAGVALPPEAMRLLDNPSDASLYAGLHALGLKMEQKKAPLPLLVVDSVSKTPTEN
jgi:uncharacterized protein (TIGR03435 family)